MKTGLMICALAAAIMFAASIDMMGQTSVFLTVPTYPEEALTWCGAAVGQMILGGYPSGACTVAQADVWASIQTHKVEAVWDTDPDGLKGALTDSTLCPPRSWIVDADTNASTVMHAVAYWMNTNRFPVGLVLKTDPHNAIVAHKEHWVVVKGIVTDIAPTPGNTVNLLYVLVVDPAQANVGDAPIERFFSGSDWYGTFQTVSIGSTKYGGKYVAVIEPPVQAGKAIAKVQPVTGIIISPERALAAARRAISTDLRRAPAFAELQNLQPQTPLLVNRDRGAYYLVPVESGTKAPTLAVLINAYSGEFMEAARFRGRPMRPIVTRDEAVARAARFLRRSRPPSTAAAALISPPDAPSPYSPQWSVSIEGQQLVVDPEGNVRKPAKRSPQ